MKGFSVKKYVDILSTFCTCTTLENDMNSPCYFTPLKLPKPAITLTNFISFCLLLSKKPKGSHFKIQICP